MIIDFTGDLLTKGYVYYDRLKESKDPRARRLYKNALSSLQRNVDLVSDTEYASNTLLAAAQAERAKEYAVLQKCFNGKIHIDLGAQDAGKNLIQLFNEVLSTKEIYERNINRILGAEKDGKKFGAQKLIDISTFMGSYLQSVIWERLQKTYITKWSKTYNAAVQAGKANAEQLTLSQMRSDLSRRLPDWITDGIAKALSSKEFSNSGKDSKGAYEEFLRELKNSSSTASQDLKRQVMKLYKVDELAEEIKRSVLQNFSTNLNSMARKKAIKNDVSSYFAKSGNLSGQTAGSMAEYLYTFIGSALSNMNNNKMNFTHTGASQGKADIIVSFGVPTQIIQQANSKIEGNSREQAVKIITDMEKQLQNFNDHALIYVNAKNYKLRDDGRFAFKTGSEFNAASLKGVLEQVDAKKADLLVGSIVQLCKGAIGQQFTATFSRAIAMNIGELLFDDVQNIGQQMRANAAGNSIHVFLLNGIYIPLSTLLFQLGNAFQTGENITQSVSVSINSPDILWADDSLHPGGYTSEDWDEQASDAEYNTRITVKFLRNFKQLIEQLR